MGDIEYFLPVRRGLCERLSEMRRISFTDY